MRTLIAALVIPFALSSLALPGAASAGELGNLQASLKSKGDGAKKKIVIRLELPEQIRKKLQKKRAKVKVNVYAGKDADSTKKIKGYEWRLRKKLRKWSFQQKDLCKKGHKHVRIKIKAKGMDDVQKTLDLDC